jgi:hypothetical protein
MSYGLKTNSHRSQQPSGIPVDRVIEPATATAMESAPNRDLGANQNASIFGPACKPTPRLAGSVGCVNGTCDLTCATFRGSVREVAPG